MKKNDSKWVNNSSIEYINPPSTDKSTQQRNAPIIRLMNIMEKIKPGSSPWTEHFLPLNAKALEQTFGLPERSIKKIQPITQGAYTIDFDTEKNFYAFINKLRNITNACILVERKKMQVHLRQSDVEILKKHIAENQTQKK